MYDDLPGPLGIVPIGGRGSLPFALVHGESLVAAASWALGAAEVELLDWGVGAEAVRESGRPLVVHDPLCPLTPVDFLVEAVEECERTGAVVVGVRPVTDTVKEHARDEDGLDVLGATVDRESLMSVCSPLVLPASVVAALTEPGSGDDAGAGPGAGLGVVDLDDLAGTVAALVRRVPVRYLPAPALARRVTGVEDLEVLAALSSALGGAAAED